MSDILKGLFKGFIIFVFMVIVNYIGTILYNSNINL